jgi:hypothetical protein
VNYWAELDLKQHMHFDKEFTALLGHGIVEKIEGHFFGWRK